MFALLQLCDSLFPIGAFSHSDGLEAATASGAIRDGRELGEWLDVCLDDVLARCEGPAVWRAWRAASERRWTELRSLDDSLHAMRPSATGRQAIRAMGTRLVKTWRQIHPNAGLDECCMALGRDWTLPVAFGMVCAVSDIDARSAVEGFVYTRLASSVSAAMRLISIGQNEAHRLLSDTLRRAPAAIDEMIARDAEPSMFAPQTDIAGMSHQYVHSKLFRS